MVTSGHGLKKITMKWSGDGATTPGQPLAGFGGLVALLLGYLGPTVAGLLGAEMLAHGSADLLLWLIRAGLVLMLLASRGIFGPVVICLLLIATFFVAWTTTATSQSAFCYVLIWFLLIGGVRDVAGITGIYLRGQAKGSDPHVLRRNTKLPMFFWLLVFWAGSVGGLWLGYQLLMAPD
jgi:hypothetical protein